MENKEEIWKPYPEIPNYLVSNLGRVYNSKRSTYMKPYLLAPKYKYVAYNIGRSMKLAHRLVAQTFIENPDKLPQVHHKDHNPKNNEVDNLEWVTTKQNLDEARLRSGDTTPIARLALKKVVNKPVKMLSKDNELIKIFNSVKEASTYNNNFSGAKIGMVANGLRETHQGYRWEWVNPESAKRGRRNV